MTVKQIKVGVSPITNQIFVGYVNKKGDTWTTKQDATNQITNDRQSAVFF